MGYRGFAEEVWAIKGSREPDGRTLREKMLADATGAAFREYRDRILGVLAAHRDEPDFRQPAPAPRHRNGAY